MEETLRDLGEILLKALPTFFLVLVLYVYLARMFFRPLERVLQKRYEATEGARKLSEESVAKAAAKMEQYEGALRVARGEVYQEIEQLRRQLQQERTAAIETARKKAEAQIGEAKARLEAEVAKQKLDLAGQSAALASQIADATIRRRVA